MTTIREILDIEKNGRNTIKENKELNAILECVDDLTGVFIGSKRIEAALNELDGSYVGPLKRAMNTLKVYENKMLNEEVKQWNPHHNYYWISSCIPLSLSHQLPRQYQVFLHLLDCQKRQQ